MARPWIARPCGLCTASEKTFAYRSAIAGGAGFVVALYNGQAWWFYGFPYGLQAFTAAVFGASARTETGTAASMAKPEDIHIIKLPLHIGLILAYTQFLPVFRGHRRVRNAGGMGRPGPFAPATPIGDNESQMKYLLLTALAVTAYGQINYAKIEILTEKYTPNLYMLAGAPGDADLNHPDGAGGRIGILTGGGDCPGLNGVIRAVTLHARHTFGWEVVGIRNGFEGLYDEDDDEESIPDISQVHCIRFFPQRLA